MSTTKLQGRLWGERVEDYATIIEPLFTPVYERVFDETRVGAGTRLLDVGCGPGLAVQIAAQRGAWVSGLDAAEASLTIAYRRTPEGNFRLGDMEHLPWSNNHFNVVTSFNAFQFAADPIEAVKEAKRVVKLEGYIAVVVWGYENECETFVTMGAVGRLLSPIAEASGVSWFTPDGVEALLEEVDMTLVSRGKVDCAFEFPDLESAIQGLSSAGMMVAASERVGIATVQHAISESLTSFRRSDGSYCQNNRFCYFIAEA
jgi:SAM-dependent methyltransferase